MTFERSTCGRRWFLTRGRLGIYYDRSRPHDLRVYRHLACVALRLGRVAIILWRQRGTR